MNRRAKLKIMSLIRTKFGGIGIITRISDSNPTIEPSYSIEFLKGYMKQGDYNAWVGEKDLELLLPDVTPILIKEVNNENCYIL